MTDQTFTFPKFYVTMPNPCPYLAGKVERKIFTELAGANPPALNEALSQAGFRRSQSVAYRPACEGCNACVSVRVRAGDFTWSRGRRRVVARNRDLVTTEAPPWATSEQYELLKRYLSARHPGGGMSEMSIVDYAEMVETSPVETHLVEYRLPADDPSPLAAGKLIAVALMDVLSDGLSMVYSFYDPAIERRSLGTYLILHQVERAVAAAKPYVYLGYLVAGSPKMGYKARFRPLEQLSPAGWAELP